MLLKMKYSLEAFSELTSEESEDGLSLLLKLLLTDSSKDFDFLTAFTTGGGG